MNNNLKSFIAEHMNDDIHQLALNASKYPNINIQDALVQINGRKKIKNKVPLFFENEDILYPIQLSLEQSSSQITATYKSSLCNGNLLVDLTGGLGVDSYFMSEHFENSIYVEKNEVLCELAKHNFSSLNRQNIKVINALSETYLHEIIHTDWIYLDPARRDTSGKKLVLLSDCEPDVSILAPTLLSKADNVMVKLSPMLDINAVMEQLPQISEIHILSIDNECKELLLILNNEIHTSTLIKTINFQKNGTQQFDFNLNDEQVSTCIIANEIENFIYLYEANSSIMKAGAFKHIGQRFNLHKLHIHTHLYVSNKLHADFPGRIFSIKRIWEKDSWKTNARSLKKANIATRNFPISVDEIRKKLKLSDGGETYLFACTFSDNKKLIIETVKA